MPKLLHEAKKINRLIGLSNPRHNRKVQRMKRIPSNEKIDVIRSVICMALSWLSLSVGSILICSADEIPQTPFWCEALILN